jgi:hypothetical protein
LVTYAVISGVDATEDVFFYFKFSNFEFRWLRFVVSQTFRHRGASVGGFGIESIIVQTIRLTQLDRSNSKG